MSVTLLAAVDVAGGRATQVLPGQMDDPEQVARGWVAQGAPWVHLVDLDRAHRRGGDPGTLERLVRALPVPVQLSGGLADRESVDWALGTGARRVNLAVTALRDPAWVGSLVAEHGDRIAVGLDLAGDQVVARGSGEHLGDLEDVLAALDTALSGARPGAVVVADARRDGTRAGADTRVFAPLVQRLTAPVIASGGVAGPADLRALCGVGVSGVVLGSALYHRSLTMAQALEIAA